VSEEGLAQEDQEVGQMLFTPKLLFLAG